MKIDGIKIELSEGGTGGTLFPRAIYKKGKIQVAGILNNEQYEILKNGNKCCCCKNKRYKILKRVIKDVLRFEMKYMEDKGTL